MHTINKYIANNQEFTFIELKNEYISATFMDYGATVLNINTPDKDGNVENIVIAYDQLKSYIKNDMFLNATVGPLSGRTANGAFKIDDQVIQLDKNFMYEANLHGGRETIAFKFFDYSVSDQEDKVIFTYFKKEEASLFPGNQVFKIAYTLKENTLLMEFIASTDKDTYINLTNHNYYNLSGNLKTDIMNQELYINSSQNIELDDGFIPTKLVSSLNTHLDFKTQKPIKDNFFDGIYDLKENGIDNPLQLDEVSFDIPQVKMYDPISKRTMELYTTYPTVVCYTHNYSNESLLQNGIKHNKHMGICFETQYEPNGINIEGIANRILRKDQPYHEKTLLKFYTKE